MYPALSFFRSISGMSLNQGQPSGEPVLLQSASPENGMPVYQDFPRNCWSVDGNTLYAVTPNEGLMICLAITIQPSVQVTKIEQVDTLLWVTENYLLVGSSTSVSTPFLRLLNIKQNYSSETITTSNKLVIPEPMVQFVYGDVSPPAIYHGPPIESVAPNSIPLIVYPHGGPHSTFVDTFAREVVFFLKLGFAVLRLNYVGSTGGTKDTADELLGKIGDRDVKDCQGIVEKVLNSIPTLNPDKVVVFGGSHGGFLGCHLSSQYPNVYKAAVLRNPVTDLGTLVGTSDITDWTYVI